MSENAGVTEIEAAIVRSHRQTRTWAIAIGFVGTLAALLALVLGSRGYDRAAGCAMGVASLLPASLWLWNSARPLRPGGPLRRALRDHPAHVVWIYSLVESLTNRAGTELRRTHAVMIGLEDGELARVNVAPAAVRPLTTALGARCPDATMGFSDDHEDWFAVAPASLRAGPRGADVRARERAAFETRRARRGRRSRVTTLVSLAPLALLALGVLHAVAAVGFAYRQHASLSALATSSAARIEALDDYASGFAHEAPPADGTACPGPHAVFAALLSAPHSRQSLAWLTRRATIVPAAPSLGSIFSSAIRRSPTSWPALAREMRADIAVDLPPRSNVLVVTMAGTELLEAHASLVTIDPTPAVVCRGRVLISGGERCVDETCVIAREIGQRRAVIEATRMLITP